MTIVPFHVRLPIVVALALAGPLVAERSAVAQPQPPELTKPVNDFAGVIDESSARALDALIRELQGKSGDSVVVATVKTFKPWADLRAYATAMFENGGKGLGAKGKDNGLLVVLALDDRQVWVEVGYDLEGIITDGFAGETSRQVMAPWFREGDYGRGLFEGTARLIERIARSRNVALNGLPAAEPAPGSSRGVLAPEVIALGLILIIILLSLKNVGGSGPRRHWRGGVGPWGGTSGGTWGIGGWGGGSPWRGSSGGFGGFGGGRSGGGGGGTSW